MRWSAREHLTAIFRAAFFPRRGCVGRPVRRHLTADRVCWCRPRGIERDRGLAPGVGRLRGVSCGWLAGRAGGAELWTARVLDAVTRCSPSGVAFWVYPRAWATAEVRGGAGEGELQVYE